MRNNQNLVFLLICWSTIIPLNTTYIDFFTQSIIVKNKIENFHLITYLHILLDILLNIIIIIWLTQRTNCRERWTDIHTVETERMGEIGWKGVRMVWRQDATRPPPRNQVTWSSDATTADQAVNKQNTVSINTQIHTHINYHQTIYIKRYYII